MALMGFIHNIARVARGITPSMIITERVIQSGRLVYEREKVNCADAANSMLNNRMLIHSLFEATPARFSYKRDDKDQTIKDIEKICRLSAPCAFDLWRAAKKIANAMDISMKRKIIL
jgi:hypothetical protein